MYFAQLPFNKDQHVKLKIPDQNLKDDVINTLGLDSRRSALIWVY